MPVDEQDFVNVPLFDEPFWVAYPRQYHFYDRGKITLRDLGYENLLLLFEGHCLAKQAMDLCHIGDLVQQGEMADLRAASLEKLFQLVRAGSGATLLPALAMQGPWATGSGVTAQPLSIANALRHLSLVYCQSLSRIAALQEFADIILNHLPNTVSRSDQHKSACTLDR